jgi:hypothetical protein
MNSGNTFSKKKPDKMKPWLADQRFYAKALRRKAIIRQT